MCQFCEALKDKNKDIIWNVRSTYADDNICEIINDKNCSLCNGCIMEFNLKGHVYNEDVYVSVEYNQELVSSDRDEVIIRPFSEAMQFNYCPICGEQISKIVRKNEEYYKNQISIVEIED